VYELSHLAEENFLPILNLRDPYQEKIQKIFLVQMWQFIHQSKALIELIRNMLFLRMVKLIS